MSIYLCYLSLLLLSSPVLIIAQDATTIIRKVDQKMRGETSRAQLSMKIIRPNWTREIQMKSWSKGEEYAMVLITAPARDKGVAYLKKGKEIWNWQPSIDRTIKLPPSMMMQSWMGSDFTNDDLVQQSSIVEDFHHQLTGDTTINGKEVYRIKLTPKKNAAVVWGKIVMWVGKEDYIEYQTKFYDEQGELINTMKAHDVREFDGRKLPAKMEVIPADKKGQKTVLEYESMDFNKPLKADFFTVQNMKRLR